MPIEFMNLENLSKTNILAKQEIIGYGFESSVYSNADYCECNCECNCSAECFC